MGDSVYTSEAGEEIYASDIENMLKATELPRIPTMQTTTDVLPLFLIAMTDLAKTVTHLVMEELKDS